MTPWARALLALRLSQADPVGCGGMVLRCRPCPARDALLTCLPDTPTRLHPAMGLEALEGGLDIPGSLSEGKLVAHAGLLDGSPRTFLLAMAERCPPLLANCLCDALDRGAGHRVIALDESAEEGEGPSPALLDRLAFHVSLDGIPMSALSEPEKAETETLSQSDLSAIDCPDDLIEELVSLAVQLGVTSLRAPTLAVNAARAHAALNSRISVDMTDIQIAAELVLAPRATRLPQETPDEPEAPESTAPEPPSETPKDLLPQELLLEAIQTALPAGLLDQTGSDTAKSGTGSGSGAKRTGNRRGRPLPARGGRSGNTTTRVDLMATLRAAVPWQTLRRREEPDRIGPILRPSDLRHKRYEELSDRLLIFAVDASGSAALARLAEAKGAVELLLAEAYARRDHVALIAFRGEGAELLLPPTRSLVQTKRRLAELPGGGGTPLAQGLVCGLETALTARRKGLSPTLILLTDGRANITLNGTADRAQAAEDATRMARACAAQGIDSIVIDTSRRPEHALRELALSLRGHYASLPRADAASLSKTVTAALDG